MTPARKAGGGTHPQEEREDLCFSEAGMYGNAYITVLNIDSYIFLCSFMIIAGNTQNRKSYSTGMLLIIHSCQKKALQSRMEMNNQSSEDIYQYGVLKVHCITVVV